MPVRYPGDCAGAGVCLKGHARALALRRKWTPLRWLSTAALLWVVVRVVECLVWQ